MTKYFSPLACLIIILTCRNNYKQIKLINVKTKIAASINAVTKDSVIVISDTENNIWTDTFIVNNSKFAYHIDIDSSNGDYNIGQLSIMKFSNNHRSKYFSYQYSNRTNKVLLDVNNDGFIDLVNGWKWFSEVYFYNPDKKEIFLITCNLCNNLGLFQNSRTLKV